MGRTAGGAHVVDPIEPVWGFSRPPLISTVRPIN
jgi:hypothetical protein